MNSPDPSTPVIIGVGQASERPESPAYLGLSPVDLAAEAARNALDDAGGDRAGIYRRVDTVAAIRQFEISTPDATAPLGRSDNFPRSVADRVGLAPSRAILEVSGGQSPQHLVTELMESIARDETNGVAVVFGAEAISTVRHFASSDSRPDFSENRGGPLEDRGYGLQGLVQRLVSDIGLTDAASQYALLENARRARLSMSVDDYARAMGELFEPFTKVAAKNDHAAAPTERSAKELITVTDRNRMIADPYTRFLIARDQVNQAAAVAITSVRVARELNIASERWVFVHGHADLREQRMLDRADLSTGPASIRAAQHALEIAQLDPADLTTLDLYSCFPIAVFNICEGLGLQPNDRRGLTVTGGLPFFGGAGNNYSMHAIADTVMRLRDSPGCYGFVGANGGVLSKYSAAVYSTTPTNWRSDDSAGIQRELDSRPCVVTTDSADGWARIESYTIKHTKDTRFGIVVGRLDDGRRFLATTIDGDDGYLAILAEGNQIGQRAFVRHVGNGNRITLNAARCDRLLPQPSPSFSERYEHVLVERRDRILEVTINRPECRNALTPQANQELERVFDAFFADPDLWVAIITGAGEKAFCAGNDLRYTASGEPLWVPRSGFGGLTNRRGMGKPVIAAVSGYAMGGGCEIALACHLVVADPTAQFALSEVKVGLIAGAGGLVRLPRTVPAKVANEMILTGKAISAGDAYRYGLINRVSRPGAVLDEARALAAEIVLASPTSVRTSLTIMNETNGIADTVEAVLHPSRALDDLMFSADMAEGLNAFVEGRAPQWQNR